MRLLLLISCLPLLACPEKAREPLPPIADVCSRPKRSTPDFAADVAPLLGRHCTTCHRAGGIGPFALESSTAAATFATAIKASVCARHMPPWPPHRDCNQFTHDRSLSDDELLTLRDWVDDGAKVPATPMSLSATAPTSGPRADAVLTLPAPYVPVTSPDDYRCFVFDLPFDDERFITGFGVRPDRRASVHHVVVFKVSADRAQPMVEAQAASTDGPGYPCFGGPSPAVKGAKVTAKGLPSMVGIWAPGVEGVDFPAGTGIRLPPGSKLVAQVHYNVQTPNPEADRSSITLELEPTVTREAFMIPFGNPSWVQSGTMTIPARARDTAHFFRLSASTLTNRASKNVLSASEPVELLGQMLHMHTRGSWASFSVERASESVCALNIPAWDFHWQGMYFFEKPIVVQPSDEFRIECHFDNSGGDEALTGEKAPTTRCAWASRT
ncbi:MAG: monooxygenase [Archangiaceae bacterium]|nr:monooxygenase [Archangiaceae bacterium]